MSGQVLRQSISKRRISRIFSARFLLSSCGFIIASDVTAICLNNSNELNDISTVDTFIKW